MPKAPRPFAALSLPLLAVGVAWAVGSSLAPSWPRLLIALVVAGVAAIPAVSRLLERALRNVREPSKRLRRSISLGVWLAALVFLVYTAFSQQRELFPKVHDEHSYVLQTRMLAQGRLWMPQHELAEFFESFHILTTPKYASIYFPGTALLNVPAVWLDLPLWELPVVMAAIVVALTYRITTELIDGVWGLAAAFMVLGVGLFRTHSTLVMAQIPAALLGLLTVWAYLRWRRGKHRRFALLIGVFASWAAVTRPVDAIAFAAPVGLAMLLDFRRLKWPRRFTAVGLVIAGAAPFLVLQLTFNFGVTGHLFRTPYVEYLDRYQPGSQFGVNQSRGQPATELIQKREYFEQLAGMRSTPWERLKTLAVAALPATALAALVPLALLEARRHRRFVMAAPPLLFFGLYLLNPFYLPHYNVPLAPPLAFCVALGGSTLSRTLANDNARRSIAAFLVVAIVGLTLIRLPQTDATVRDEWISLPAVQIAHDALPQAVQTPAVVLFRYHAGGNVHDEPVYNDDVAWPDDARILRAHDLGERNRKMFEYYAARRPERSFYLFDRGDDKLYPLGTAADLARKPTMQRAN